MLLGLSGPTELHLQLCFYFYFFCYKA